MYATRAHTISRAMEDCPCTPNEETYHRELWEEIPGLYNNRMTDEEFEIFARLDGGVRVGSRELVPSEEFYIQADHAARYFNDEDLYQYSEDEYDYPRGVEDEYDAYMWSDELDDEKSFNDRGDVWPSSRDDDVRGVPLNHEGQSLEARYFDANDLYDRVEMGNPANKDKSKDRRSQATEDIFSKRRENGSDRSPSTVRGEQWPRTFFEEKSPIQTRHDRVPYMRTQTMLRSRAQSG